MSTHMGAKPVPHMLQLWALNMQWGLPARASLSHSLTVCHQGLMMHVDTILLCKPSLSQVLLLVVVSACIPFLLNINLSSFKVQINIYSVPLIYMLYPVNTVLPTCASTGFNINLPSECNSVSLVLLCLYLIKTITLHFFLFITLNTLIWRREKKLIRRGTKIIFKT